MATLGLSFEEAIRLHGHAGPFLALGYRAGRYAVDVLKPQSIHDLHAILHLPLRTPYTCIADGVQAATCCTLGKGNIELREAKRVCFVFYCGTRKRSLTLLPRLEVLEKILQDGSDYQVQWVLQQPIDQLFVITH